MRNDTTSQQPPACPPGCIPRKGRLFSSLRLMLAVVVLAGLLAYLTPLALTRFVGQDVLRAQAQDALEAALYRPVDIKGEVRLTLIPWFGLRTGPVSVANSPGFGPQPLVSVDSATIELSLLALARRHVIVDSVSLSSATVNIERDAQGRENWRAPQPEAAARPAPSAPSGWEVERLPTGLRLWNASVHFTDQLTGSNIDLHRLNLNTTPSSPFDFSASCELTVLPLGLKGELHAQGQGSYGPTGGSVFVRQSQAAGWLELPEAEGRPGGRMQFSGGLGFHGEAGAFEISRLVLEGLGARVTGQINAAGIYERTPYMALNLSATASRHGAWAALLGVDPSEGPALRAPGEQPPAIKRAPDEADVEAALVLNYGPAGWKAESFSLRHEEGRVTGWAGLMSGELDFDVRAEGVDLARWAPARLSGVESALQRVLSGGSPAGTGLEAVRGHLKGKHLRLGGLDIAEAELSAKGENGQLRVYPLTARTPHALLTADLRGSLAPTAPGFSCQATVQALSPGQGPPFKAFELSAEGSAKASGLAGNFRCALGEMPQGWAPPWLTENVANAWRTLGGASVSAALRLPGAEERLADLNDLDIRTAASHVTGRAGLTPSRVTLDLAADRLDTDRLQLAASFLGPGGDTPLPPIRLEGRMAVKHLTTPLGEFDDIQLAGQAGPDGLHLANVTGAGLGGKFTGSLDYQDSGGRHGGSLALAATGVHGAQLSALLPQAPRLTGPLEGRLALEASARSGEPLWRVMHGQADLQMGIGSVAFSQEQGPSQAWPLTRAAVSLKVAAKPAASAPGADKPREAAVADVAGTLRMESPGQLRSLQTEIKGQAGLGLGGRPAWYRQPRLEGALAVDVPLRPGKPLRAAWTGKLDADFEKGSFGLTGIELNMEGVPGRASLSGQPGQGGMQLAGTVDVPEFSPRDAAQRTGIALPAKSAPELWRKARVSLDVGGNLKEVRLTRINAALDDSTLTGAATLTGTTTHADLSVNHLDLDRLAPTVQDADPGKRPDSPLPMQELRALNMDAKVRFGRLVKDRLVWENSLLTLTAQGGRFRIMQTSQQFYGGSFMMDVRGDARGQDLKAQFDLALVGFEASPLLRAVAGGETLTRGTGEFHVNVETWGATDKALRRHAAGSARFEVRAGRLVLREPGANRQQPPPTDNESLPFDSLGAHFTAREGLAISRDLAMLGPDITAKGDGWVSLPDERIDLNLLAVLRDLGELPVRISGPLYDPRVDVDKSRVLAETIMKMFKGVINLPSAVINVFRRAY